MLKREITGKLVSRSANQEHIRYGEETIALPSFAQTRNNIVKARLGALPKGVVFIANK